MESAYVIIENVSELIDPVINTLESLFQNYVVETGVGGFLVFQSLTYGEMIISLLLLVQISLMLLHWIWQANR